VVGYERFIGPCCLHLQGDVEEKNTAVRAILTGGEKSTTVRALCRAS